MSSRPAVEGGSKAASWPTVDALVRQFSGDCLRAGADEQDDPDEDSPRAPRAASNRGEGYTARNDEFT